MRLRAVGAELRRRTARLPQLPIEGICGTRNLELRVEERMIAWEIADGYSSGGRTFESSPAKCSQASVPQKSSAHRNPPLRRLLAKVDGFGLADAPAGLSHHDEGAIEHRGSFNSITR